MENVRFRRLIPQLVVRVVEMMMIIGVAFATMTGVLLGLALREHVEREAVARPPQITITLATSDSRRRLLLLYLNEGPDLLVSLRF